MEANDLSAVKSPPAASVAGESSVELDACLTQQTNQTSTNTNSNTKNKKLFPQKLWDLINDTKYNFCLRWSDDGQLVYLNRDEFEDSYLKTAENQFHTQKAISFVRQMNMYGFRKVDDCFYENDNFKKGCEYLLKNMIRKHPNKAQNASEMVPFLYRNNPNMTTNSLLHLQQQHSHLRHQTHAPVAPTSGHFVTSSANQAANSLFSLDQINSVNLTSAYKQNSSNFNSTSLYPPQTRVANSMKNDKNSTQTLNKRFNSCKQQSKQTCSNIDDRASDDEHLNVIDEESLSSFAGYCCSAGNSQSESLNNVIDCLSSKTSGSNNNPTPDENLFNLSNNTNDICEGYSTPELKLSQLTNKTTAQSNQSYLNFFPRLNQTILDTFNDPQPDNNTQDSNHISDQGAFNSLNLTTATTTNNVNNNQLSNFIMMNSALFNPSANLTNNSFGSLIKFNDGDELNSHQSAIQALYNDQRELLLKLLIDAQQQSNNRSVKDLLSNSTKPQQDAHQQNLDLSAFYALCSSINSNMYLQQQQQQSNPIKTSSISPDLDSNRLPNIQQFYQQMLLQKDQSVSSDHLNEVSNDEFIKHSRELGSMNTATNDKESLSTSLLARNKPSPMTTSKNMRSSRLPENHYGACLQSDERSHETRGTLFSNWNTQDRESTQRRKENKTTRLFKRSVDSILDSNNNSNNERVQDSHKRSKLSNNTNELMNKERPSGKTAYKFARDLVTHVAHARSSKVDPNVIYEASKYTERFVESLFDTAQVIARHSNGSSGSMEAGSPSMTSPTLDTKDNTSEEELDKATINLSDLTSAIRMLKAKIY